MYNRVPGAWLLWLLLSLPGLAQQAAAPEPAHAAPDLAHLLPAIAALPDSSRVDQLLEFTDVLVQGGRYEETAPTLREAAAVAQASGRPVLESRVELSQGYVAAQLADFAEALRHYQRALDLARAARDVPRQIRVLTRISGLSYQTRDWPPAIRAQQQALGLARQYHLPKAEAGVYGELSNLAGMQHRPAEALAYNNQALAMYRAQHDTVSYYGSLLNQGIVLKNLGRYAESARSYRQVLAYARRTRDSTFILYVDVNLPRTLLRLGQAAEAEQLARQSLALATRTHNLELLHEANDLLAAVQEQQGQYQAALGYQRAATRLQDSIFNQQKSQQLLATDARYQARARQAQIGQLAADNTRQQRQLLGLLAGLGMIVGLAAVLWRSNRQRLKANALLERQKAELQTQRDHTTQALADLRATQNQLIQKEKMASLGELTAGIAHEIQNPLNFVNNFADVSAELVAELKEAQAAGDGEEVAALADDLSQNLGKIHQHGQRAAGIVRGMLEHSRQSTGERQPTDVNALCDEYLRLAYHGLRAKDKSFNATLETDFAPSLPVVEAVAGDLGRVLLNLLTNAFYAVQQRQQAGEAGYQPTVSMSTRQVGGSVEIRVADNGTGMPAEVQAKIFQPFFTTKPTGEGTGLGLSLSYDIITKAHGGSLNVASQAGEGTTFTVRLPC
ncbi:tetratricopeptide repeat-containing sensor histidine kinase [Hymenobacter polaris]|nr:ATP-binding protein [Hymenobacter polaris]